MFRFSRSSIGVLRTARWYSLALTVVLAVSAGEPTVAFAAAPSPAAGDGFPVPALLGGMVLAFAVGLTAAQVRRRRRAAPPPAETVATAEPPPPEPAPPPRPWEAWVERPRPEPGATPEPPPPKPAAPSRPRPRVVRLEPPRAAPPPPPPPVEPVEPAWVPPEPVDPAARSARGPSAAPDRALLQAPEAPVPEEAAPAAAAPAHELDEAPESPVGRPSVRPAPRDEPWPDEAQTLWTCEIVWKAGYVKSSFGAMAGAPGSSRRRQIGESPPLRWTLMIDPDPPTAEMVAGVRALVDALIAAGWERTGSAGPWYAQRFLWRGSGRPGSVVVEPPMDAGEASSA